MLFFEKEIFFEYLIVEKVTIEFTMHKDEVKADDYNVMKKHEEKVHL